MLTCDDAMILARRFVPEDTADLDLGDWVLPTGTH
jgi:hypothetical protein